MKGCREYNKKNISLVMGAVTAIMLLLAGRISYLMVFNAERYIFAAEQLHERERSIKAARGRIYDRNNVIIADNKPVCTISVIYNQMADKEMVIDKLSSILELDEEKVRKKVMKYSSRELIKSNVDKAVADTIRELELPGVIIDEDYKRYYPYETLASKVLGFTGGDNQGIIGLEVKYDNSLQGIPGRVLTTTTAHGLEIDKTAEHRVEPVPGNDLYISLDVNIQQYAEQICKNIMVEKGAKSVSMIVMNPVNGEMFAMVDLPEFDLNKPYEILNEYMDIEGSDMDKLNRMWRNTCINDTYEPGSAFKIVTATAAFEEKKVSLSDGFFCPGFKRVADRIIRCHKTTGHGSETFVQGIQNSCNPVFMEIGARVGAEGMYKNFKKLGLMSKTGIDLPGEANSIMHKIDNIKEVELATISFGQSFQITPLQLITAVSAVANGGTLVTPHFGVKLVNSSGDIIKSYEYKIAENVISKATSDTMKELLESVVSVGTGKRAYLEGFRIAGKTATSEKLPRSQNKYIASFVGFAPADNPAVIAIVLINEPLGIYYGGTIAAPAIAELFDNILPYLGINPIYTEGE